MFLCRRGSSLPALDRRICLRKHRPAPKPMVRAAVVFVAADRVINAKPERWRPRGQHYSDHAAVDMAGAPDCGYINLARLDGVGAHDVARAISTARISSITTSDVAAAILMTPTPTQIAK